MKRIFFVLFLILSTNLLGQNQKIGLEAKIGVNYTLAIIRNRNIIDTNQLKIYYQDLNSRFGYTLSFESLIPLSKKWKLNCGLLMMLSNLTHNLDSKLKFGSGQGADSKIQANIGFLELGVPLYVYRTFGNNRLGIGLEARYIFTRDIQYIFYESGVKTNVSIFNKNKEFIDNKNFVLGLSYLNYPFSNKKAKRLGWGIDFRIYLSQEKLYVTNTPYRRMNCGVNFVYKI
jgi:hypothetical protein